jgi:hypothetical protein
LIENCNWHKVIFDAGTIDSATENFTSKCCSLICECIPEQAITIHSGDKPWYDSVLRRTLIIRDRLRDKALQTKQEAHGPHCSPE